MLRRPATMIKLTPEDILEYDDSLSSRGNSTTQEHHNDLALQEQVNADSTTNQPEHNIKEQTKDERLGLTRNN